LTSPVAGEYLPVPQAPAHGSLASPAFNDTIDVASALSRMGGMEKLYMRSAKDLLVVLPTVVATLSEALQARDSKRCAMLLHTIKGNASTLGLNALARMLAGLEALCKAEDGMAICASQCDELTRCIDTTQSALRDALHLLAAGANSDAGAALGVGDAGSAANTVPLESAIARLMPLLEAEDFAALAVFSEERGALEGLPPEALRQLEMAIQDLDWGTGLHVLKHAAFAD
jgi:HPt (histidine-containing phosphotransfer) domain-containing protein